MGPDHNPQDSIIVLGGFPIVHSSRTPQHFSLRIAFNRIFSAGGEFLLIGLILSRNRLRQSFHL
jgi:hypothetical protein